MVWWGGGGGEVCGLAGLLDCRGSFRMGGAVGV